MLRPIRGLQGNMTATLSNATFGDVYMCAGQSNVRHCEIILRLFLTLFGV